MYKWKQKYNINYPIQQQNNSKIKDRNSNGLSTGHGLVNLQYLVGRALSSCLQMHQCCPAQGLGHTHHTSCKGTEKVSSHTQCMHQLISLFTHTDVKSVIQKQNLSLCPDIEVRAWSQTWTSEGHVITAFDQNPKWFHWCLISGGGLPYSTTCTTTPAWAWIYCNSNDAALCSNSICKVQPLPDMTSQLKQ